MMNAVQKLQSVFQETLEDIPISINAFILDKLNTIGKDDNRYNRKLLLIFFASITFVFTILSFIFKEKMKKD